MAKNRYYFTVTKVEGGYTLEKTLSPFFVTECREKLIEKIMDLLKNPEKIPS